MDIHLVAQQGIEHVSLTAAISIGRHVDSESIIWTAVVLCAPCSMIYFVGCGRWGGFPVV